MKAIIGLFFLLFIIVIVTITTMQGKSLNFLPKGSTVLVDGHTITVDVARAQPQQDQGLSGRKSMPTDHGMLFVFDKADYHAFWMKNMQFPLDMLFINGDKIVTILQDVPTPAPKTPDTSLPVYTSTAPADKVLELNAGTVKKDGIKPGDTVTIAL